VVTRVLVLRSGGRDFNLDGVFTVIIYLKLYAGGLLHPKDASVNLETLGACR
jgi:hypothetical protein